jgi:hypothetical protein
VLVCKREEVDAYVFFIFCDTNAKRRDSKNLAGANPIKENKLRSLKIDKEKKIHTRDMKIATYAYDDAHIIVEGELNDNRIIPNFCHTGELYPPGNIHYMFIRLLIEIESIRIARVEIEMPGIPHHECPEAIPSFVKLEGMRITPGFTSKVRNIIGGPKGCAHLRRHLVDWKKPGFNLCRTI